MWLAVFIVGFITAVTAYLYHVILNTTYWKRRGIPSVPSSNILLNQLNEVTSYDYPICFQLSEWTKEYGPIYGIFCGIVPELVISDPAMVHDLLNKKFENFYTRRNSPLLKSVVNGKRAHLLNARGARWKRLRTITSPIFSMGNLRRLVPVVDKCCGHTMVFFDKAYENGTAFNIKPYFHEFTMDVMCHIALGHKQSNQFNNPLTKLIDDVFKSFGGTPFERLAFLAPRLSFLVLQMFIAQQLLTRSPFFKVLGEIRKAVNDRFKQKESGTYKTPDLPDFIDFFLELLDEDIIDGAFSKSNAKVSKKITREEVIGQCFAFMLAGYDTTADTLTTSSWFLAKYPEFQEQLYDEIQEVCDTPEVTYEQLGQLKHVDALMKEILRLHPIATGAVARECMESTTLGNIPVEKGTNVWVDLITLNQNKEIWGDDADEFRPERFFDVTTEMQNAMVNFGSGPRICIGMKLAYIEEKLALVHILRKYRIVATDETEEKLHIIGRAVQSAETVTVKLELR